MRTTITFDDDVAAAIEKVKQDRSVGVSEAVNDLIRSGLMVRKRPRRYEPRPVALGLKIDVTNVAEALELLEGPDHR